MGILRNMLVASAFKEAELYWYEQVVYPALDAKVRNVTLAYSVEHEDEVTLCLALQALREAKSSTATSCRPYLAAVFSS
jgi:hypothetical protein